MSIRLALVSCIVGMSLSIVPVAKSADAVVFTFSGTVTLNDGLSFPCLPPTGFPFGVGKCPVLGSANTRGFSFATTTCAEGGVGSLPPLFPPEVMAGGCSIEANGVVSGWCGVASGSGSGQARAAVAVGSGPPQKDYPLTFTFVVTGSTLTGTGTAGTGATLVISGAVQAVPGGVPFVSNSCVSKSAMNFTFTGTATITG